MVYQGREGIPRPSVHNTAAHTVKVCTARPAGRVPALHTDSPREVVKPENLGVDVTPRVKTVKVSEPPKRSAGIKVPDMTTLVAKLKNEAKVI